MKFFKTAVAALMLGAAAVQAIPSANTVVGAFRSLTTTSANLRTEVEKINLLNAPLQGFKIAQGFGVIIRDVGVVIPMLATNRKRYESADALVKRQGEMYSVADARIIVVALTEFVKVHQALLNIVIGKRGLLTLFPFLEPIRVSLVQLEAIVDSFAFALIALIPTGEKPAFESQFGSLDVTVNIAITTYSSGLIVTN